MNQYLSPIYINHAASQRPALWGKLLLVLGGIFCGSVLFYAQHLSATETALQNQTAALNQSARTAQPMRSAEVSNSEANNNQVGKSGRFLQQVGIARRTQQGSEEAAHAKAVIQAIVTPWQSLFRSLEKANTESVKLLKVEPNARQHLVRIAAIAGNVDDMMAYIDNLNQQTAVRQAELSSHEQIEINGHSAVQFMVDAVWPR